MAPSVTALIVAALCCGLALAGPPSDLKAELGDNKGDFVNVKLQWSPATCWPVSPDYEVFLVFDTPDGHRQKQSMGTTEKTQFTIQDVEFWTPYEIVLETSWCWNTAGDVSVNITTPPGNPHKVSSVRTNSGSTYVNVSVSEALTMPKIPDQYNFTACSADIDRCYTQILPRNSVATPYTKANQIRIVMQSLVPKTEFNLSVVPTINFEKKQYNGEAFQTKFVTEDYKYPVPKEFTQKMNDSGSLVVANISWKLTPAVDLVLAFFNLSLREANGHLLYTGQSNHTSATFSDLPFFADLSLQVLPVFNFSGIMRPGKPAVYNFSTPHGKINPPINFQHAELSPRREVLGWEAHKGVSAPSLRYDVYYSSGQHNGTLLNLNVTMTTVDFLLPNTTYAVRVFAKVGKTVSDDYLNGTFTTRATEWPSVSNISAVVTNNASSSGAAYNVSWTVSELSKELAYFEVSRCDAKQACVKNQTHLSNFQTSLAYFQKFSVSVSAHYKLALNQTVDTNATTSSIVTPGTNPAPVTGVAATNVTARGVTLSWKAPANVPAAVQRHYLVSDGENQLDGQSPTESIEFTTLHPYKTYNVSIQTHADYENVTYRGNETFFGFTSDVAAPGPVQNVRAEQVAESNLVRVWWDEPKETDRNGPIDFYWVATYFANETLYTKVKAVGSRNFQIPMPIATEANYTIEVSAVNVDSLNQELVGNETNTLLEFHGVAAPVEMRLINRTDSTLSLEIVSSPSGSAADMASHLFYKVESFSGLQVMDTPNVTVKGLRPYFNETVHVRACYSETYCSVGFAKAFLTNVGAPGSVQKLTAQVFNRTNPQFSWQQPLDAHGPLTGYRVYLVDVTEPNVTFNATLKHSQTLFTFNTTDEFEKYSLTVVPFNTDLDNANRTVNGHANKVDCKTSGWSVPKPEEPKEPEMNKTAFELSWTRPEYPGFNVTWFRVEVPEHKIDNFTLKTSFALGGMTPYTKVKVALYGCTDKNATACGKARNFEASTDTDAPTAPRFMVASNVNESSATLKWQLPSTQNGPINGYRLAVVAAANKTANYTPEWIVLPGDALSFQLHGLEDATAYSADLIAFNKNSHSEELDSYAATMEFTTAGTGAAGFPVWLIVLLTIVLVAAIVAGVFLYRHKRAARDDTEHLVHA